MLDFIKNMKFYEAEDGQGGDGSNTENNGSDDGEEKPFKVFKNEEDYKNTIKSERSRAKLEILQEFEVNSVDSLKEKLSEGKKLKESFEEKEKEINKKLETTKNEFSEMKTKYTELSETHELTIRGVKEDYRKDALTLAKAKMSDESELKLGEALDSVLEKMPNMIDKKIATIKIGGQREDQDKDKETIVRNNLSKKYPWLKK